MPRLGLELEQHLGRLQRIAAELEEILVDTDVVTLQQALPDLGDLDCNG